MVRNEEKGTYSLPYLYKNYKNELEPVSVASKLVESVRQYLDDNLFSLDEKKLLLLELMPYIENFGNDTINSLNKWIGLAADREKHSQIVTECEKTIKSLKHINEIINNEFISYYTSLTSKKPQQINDQPVDISMKSKEEMQEIILDQFRKSNSRANHIVMMNVLRFEVILKLNPKEQEIFSDAAKALIDEGYISYEDASAGPECFRLTQKGYDRIYEDSFSSKPTPIIRKKKLPTSEFPNELYQDILKTLSDYGKDLEKKPKIYSGQDEEGLRDHFLTNLTGRYEKTAATGETFNKEGRTDILLKDDKGNNLFIAECKWWKGASVFHSTIYQLFDNYITWRDTKVAIIFFVNNKDFSSVLGQIEAEAKEHQYYVQYLGVKDMSSFSFLFRQKDDINNKVQVEIMLFHFLS
ncbi:MAG: hypothetical protein K2Y12_03450 [Chitinophagaceae bacterium]|nr:hypothetical protein [Chitinophagaceae bacterium]